MEPDSIFGQFTWKKYQASQAQQNQWKTESTPIE